MALIYNREDSPKKYIHNIPVEDLESDTDTIYWDLLIAHGKYLEKVNPDQVKSLIEMLKEYYFIEIDKGFDYLLGSGGNSDEYYDYGEYGQVEYSVEDSDDEDMIF